MSFFLLLNIEDILENVATKQSMVTTDVHIFFHTMEVNGYPQQFIYLYWSSFSFMLKRKRETHTGLEQVEDEQMTNFNWVNSLQKVLKQFNKLTF